MKRLTYLSIAEMSWLKQLGITMKDSRVWGSYSSTLFRKLASASAKILNGGHSLRSLFAVVEFSRSRIGCFTEHCQTGYKSLPSFTSADTLRVGRIA